MLSHSPITQYVRSPVLTIVKRFMPGKSSRDFRCASTNAASCPDLTRKRTTLNAVIAFPPGGCTAHDVDLVCHPKSYPATPSLHHATQGSRSQRDEIGTQPL